MSQDTHKGPRIHLGPVAEAFIDENAATVSGGPAKRLDSALEQLLTQVLNQGETRDQDPQEPMAILARIEKRIDEHADLQAEFIKDGFTSINRQLVELKSDLNNTHTTINVLRSFLVMVVAALRNEDLDQQTDMVMAEIDGLIKPMGNRRYDPALIRKKRRDERELAERQMSPTATEPVLASGNQFEHTNEGERKR